MFNAIIPKVYRRLRQRSGLTQGEMASALELSRYTMNKVEAGRAQLNGSQERQLLELARCSQEAFAELLCQQLSELLRRRVAIDSGPGSYEPSTALGRAHALLREHRETLPAALRRTLDSRINTAQLLGLAFERNNADLMELIEDCRQQVSQPAEERR